MTTSINKSTGGYITLRGPDADRPETKGEFPSKGCDVSRNGKRVRYIAVLIIKSQLAILFP
jgi:hypothetical protein